MLASNKCGLPSSTCCSPCVKPPLRRPQYSPCDQVTMQGRSLIIRFIHEAGPADRWHQAPVQFPSSPPYLGNFYALLIVHIVTQSVHFTGNTLTITPSTATIGMITPPESCVQADQAAFGATGTIFHTLAILQSPFPSLHHAQKARRARYMPSSANYPLQWPNSPVLSLYSVQCSLF